MATFLQLCQDVSRESGTIPGVAPSTTVGNTDRLAKIVSWTSQAYTRIQTARNDWRWLNREGELTLLANTRRTTKASLAEDGVPASRFATWLYDPEQGEGSWSAYETSQGVANERPLRFEHWHFFYRYRLRGPEDTNPPVRFSIDNQDRVVVDPVPTTEWTMRCRFKAGPQTLAADDDVPEMPEQFHQMIVWRALMFLANFDEATTQLPEWKGNYEALYGKIVQQQTPPVYLGEPMA
ncbi:MAG: hypothetical protein AAFZ14_14020 [Pseudomonadota bacterium]